jgi:protein-S-isoprenylcysteine O-methyltransferase Ste14
MPSVTVNSTINLQKILVAPLVLAFMLYFHNWSTAAFLYLGLHGTYAFLWLVKQNLYPDMRFAQRLPIPIAILTPFVPLAAYYMAPYLLISQHTAIPAWVFAVAPTIYTVGIFLHYVSDAQKYFVLQGRKGLIEDGLFARTRNPNYLGEILIYGSFALVSWHWLSILPLAGWIAYFFRNMRKKDRSLSRHQRFAQYSQRSGFLLPKLFVSKGSTISQDALAPPVVL